MITAIEKQALPKKLLHACIAKQQFLIDDFKGRIKTLTEVQGLGNEESYDSEDTANNSAKATEINELNNLLEFANSELGILENLKTRLTFPIDRVALGAIVVTNLHTFFVSASLERFQVEGNIYVGISTSSPIYQLMDGKLKGQTFTFKGTEYKIKDVF
jgi:hypothetical protein